MNSEFLKKIMWKAHYSLKAGTKNSFLFSPYVQIEALQDKKQKVEATKQLVSRMLKAGQEMLLPFRVYFLAEDSAPVSNAGRGARKKVAQLKAHFTTPEESPYKIAKPFRVCTSIWKILGHMHLYYGTIGIILGENQKPKDNGDLVIFRTCDWKEVDIYIFRGLANPNEIANLQEAVAFIEKYEALD